MHLAHDLAPRHMQSDAPPRYFFRLGIIGEASNVECREHLAKVVLDLGLPTLLARHLLHANEVLDPTFSRGSGHPLGPANPVVDAEAGAGPPFEERLRHRVLAGVRATIRFVRRLGQVAAV